MQPTAELKPIQAQMAAGRFREALAQLDALLAQDPERIEVLYMTAVCQRCTRQFGAAHRSLDRLHRLAPGFGRAHQEEGHLLRDEGRPREALASYARACQYNPALEASFRGQLQMLKALGLERRAAPVEAQLRHLLQLPRPLVAVTDLIAEGRLLKAESLCRRYLQQAPRDVEGMRLLADIAVRLGVLEDAEFLLESALAFAPDNTRVHIDYVLALRKRQKFARALEQARRLLDSAPDNPQFQSLFAIECMQSGDFDTALATFGRILTRVPEDPVTLTSMGHALKTSGRGEEAVAAYRRALAANPRHGEAWYALANLKTYRFDDGEIQGMGERSLDRTLGFMERVYLQFALGKAWEDRADYERSFHSYAAGNAMKRAQSNYRAEQLSAEMRRQAEVCSPELFDRMEGAGCPAPDPIFIVGLPRAGSTLLEQILASHSAVDGTLELPNILSLVQRLRQRHRRGKAAEYPDILADLTPAELAAFGREYLEETRIHRRGAPFFIDKMPNNFRHLGLIRLILPRARIIDARRGAMACCFSGFKQLFAEGQEFSYSLEDIGRYYRDYAELMTHWDRVLPGAVLRVRHEDVVADLEGQVRRLLDFCGLPFEESCVEFHRTRREVRTPSAEQVRQPIFDSSLDQWRHYEAWLDPLREALGPELVSTGGGCDITAA